EGAEPVTRGCCRDRAREVAGRRARDRVEPELERARERDGDGSILERQRRVARVVFEEKLRHADRGAEARRPDERRPTHGKVAAQRGDREEGRVAPERVRSPLDLVAYGLGVEGREVVLRLDRAIALAADVTLVRRLQEMARAAAQTAEPARRCAFERCRHGHLLCETEKAPRSGGLSAWWCLV